MLEAFVLRGGYLALIAGTMLEGEVVLLFAGAMAHRGLLHLPWVIGAGWVGALASDLLWFFVGGRYGRRLLARRPRWARHVDAIKRWMARSGSLFVLSFRFLYGLRTMTPIVLASTGYPLGRFLGLDVIGAAVWSSAVCLAGYGLGATVRALLGRATHLEEALAAGVVIAIVLFVWVRRRERTAEADSHPT